MKLLKQRLTQGLYAAACLMLAACVPTIKIPPLAPDHPANSQAGQTPLPAPSTVLDDPEPPPVSDEENDPHAGHGMHHEH